MAFSMPDGVSYTRCGLFPRRALPVVPLSTMAPTSRFEKPSTRVYSSPNPTQPDSRTMGDDSARPQKSTRRGDSRVLAAAFMRGALYDARPMRTQVILLSALLGAATI